LHRLARGDAGDIESAGDLFERRNQLALLPHAARDAISQRVGDLKIKRNGTRQHGTCHCQYVWTIEPLQQCLGERRRCGQALHERRAFLLADHDRRRSRGTGAPWLCASSLKRRSAPAPSATR
jgi:hypothetical protein